jgi:hypothetical protein
MEARIGAAIDSPLQNLQVTGSRSRGTISTAVNTILAEHNLSAKIESVMQLLTLLITSSSADLIDFYRVFCAEEPSAPHEVKSCGRWYRKVARERKRVIKEQGEAIQDFSSRLVKVQSTIKTLAEAHIHSKRIPDACAKTERTLSTWGPESVFSQTEKTEMRNRDVRHQKEVEDLRFEVCSLKEKCSIMRNDLNYALKQRVDMEKRLLDATALLEQKSAEALALQAMVRDVRWRNTTKRESSVAT